MYLAANEAFKYTSALSWRRHGSPSEGALGFPADIAALRLDRNTGNLLVCVNHPANRHIKPLLALATEECEMRLRLLLKGRSFQSFKVMWKNKNWMLTKKSKCFVVMARC